MPSFRAATFCRSRRRSPARKADRPSLSRRRSARSSAKKPRPVRAAKRVTPASVQPALAEINPLIARGDAGDHPGVHRFLQSLMPEISPEVFAASLEEPLYEPSDRIVARLGSRVVGHALVSRRDAYVGDALVPMVRVSQITILPELRGRGLGPKLLQAAEERIAQERASLALLATNRSAFFEQHGWLPVATVCRRQFTPRSLLELLESRPHAAAATRWRVRPWRQMEYGGLADLYERSTRGVFGAYERTEAFWRWVVGSCNPARLLVAADPTTGEGGPLAGYVILRDNAIVEVVARDNRPDILHALLHRASVEGIERSLARLTLAVTTDHPAHQLLAGTLDTPVGDGNISVLAKVYDSQALLSVLAPAIDARAKATAVDRPCELGFRINNASPFRLQFQPRSIKVAGGGVGRSYLRCTPEAAARTILGRPKSGDQLRLRGSTERARELATSVFPTLPAQYCDLEY